MQKFPIINDINDVLPHIKDNDNFSVNRKEDYIVIDYIVNTPDLFHDPVQKECRGIIFDASGKILARRLHKFFNLNERPESSVEAIDFSKKHWILEKLDGSMITPFISNRQLTWGSKAGITFLTPQVENFVTTHPGYASFAGVMHNAGFTPIFEWCSNKNRIVISHPVDRLVLLAVRDNVSGDYFSYEDLEVCAQRFDLELVQQYAGTVTSMQQLADSIKPMQGLEGFVVRFEDGLMVKIKADEYCLFHRSKDSLLHEKNVIALLAQGKADDFRVLIMDQDRKKFEEFEEKFYQGVTNTVDNIRILCDSHNSRTISRRDFAILSETWKHYRSFIFTFFDTTPTTNQIREEVIKQIKKNVSSQSRVDNVRGLWQSHKWKYE